MIVPVTMPVLGLTMEQGTVVAWLKEVGEQVGAGDPLFMVETDKATSDAPSPATGVLAEVIGREGDTVPVGAVIAYIAETAEDALGLAGEDDGAATGTGAGAKPTDGRDAPVEVKATCHAAAAAAPAAAPSGALGSSDVPPSPGRVIASPRARARARALGVDLGSAPPGAGRLTEKDVLAMSKQKQPLPDSVVQPGSPAAPKTGGSDPQVIPLTRTRRIIAERMTLSATTIPQVTYSLRCDATEAMALRRTLKAGTGNERFSVSLDAFVMRAAALALTDFPLANSQWDEGSGIRLLPHINIAVAVDLEEKGLVIPVVHQADRLNIRETAAELERLVNGARAGKLGPDDYAGATFTITSLAALGVESFTPIIVPPQVAILGVGALVPTPVFQQDQVIKRRLLTLSLTTDHRILDGAPSARLLSRIRDLLEQPAKLAE